MNESKHIDRAQTRSTKQADTTHKCAPKDLPVAYLLHKEQLKKKLQAKGRNRTPLAKQN
jgi:hypothetical protein